jgi:hypothetical protein
MWSDSVKPREYIIAGCAAMIETKDVPNEVEGCYALNITSGHIGPHCAVLFIHSAVIFLTILTLLLFRPCPLKP